jgi:hypothetical protein
MGLGCEPRKALEELCEVVGGDEGIEMPSELVVALAVEAFDGGDLESPIHPLDPAFCQRV